MVLAHGCRTVAELAYPELFSETLPNDEFLGEFVREQLIYYPTVTREPFRNQGRITGLLQSGKLSADVGLPPPAPGTDRFMLCGSPEMLTDVQAWLVSNGYTEGNHSNPGDFVIEKAFVDK